MKHDENPVFYQSSSKLCNFFDVEAPTLSLAKIGFMSQFHKNTGWYHYTVSSTRTQTTYDQTAYRCMKTGITRMIHQGTQTGIIPQFCQHRLVSFHSFNLDTLPVSFHSFISIHRLIFLSFIWIFKLLSSHSLISTHRLVSFHSFITNTY